MVSTGVESLLLFFWVSWSQGNLLQEDLLLKEKKTSLRDNHDELFGGNLEKGVDFEDLVQMLLAGIDEGVLVRNSDQSTFILVTVFVDDELMLLPDELVLILDVIVEAGELLAGLSAQLNSHDDDVILLFSISEFLHFPLAQKVELFFIRLTLGEVDQALLKGELREQSLSLPIPKPELALRNALRVDDEYGFVVVGEAHVGDATIVVFDFERLLQQEIHEDFDEERVAGLLFIGNGQDCVLGLVQTDVLNLSGVILHLVELLFMGDQGGLNDIVFGKAHILLVFQEND